MNTKHSNIFVLTEETEEWEYSEVEEQSVSFSVSVPFGYVLTEEDAKEYVAADAFNRSYKEISFLDLGKGLS